MENDPGSAALRSPPPPFPSTISDSFFYAPPYPCLIATSSAVLGQIRDALRGGGGRRGSGRRTPHKDPSDSLKVLVPRPVQDARSDEAGDSESSHEVLMVGVGPTSIDHESSKAFTHAYSMNSGFGLPPYAYRMNSGFGLPPYAYSMNSGLACRSMLPGSLFQQNPEGASNRKESKSWWSFESLQSQFYGLKRKYYQGKDIVESFKKWPGLFEQVGSDARGLLYDDFVTKSLNGSAAWKDGKMSFAIGMSLLDQESVTKLLFSGKYCNSTLALNGTRKQEKNDIADTVLSTLIFHDVLGQNTKVMLHIPYPYLRQMLEVRTLHRFAGFTGQICSSSPHLEASCLLGTHLLAFGGVVQQNKETGGVDYSVGITSRTSTCAAGFVVSNKGNVKSVETSLFKKFENDVSSAALIASLSFENQPWAKIASVIIGAEHQFPHSVTIKGRLSSKGIANVLVKKRLWDNCSVTVSTDIELGDVQKVPKFGVMFSIP